jgi:hypothetical protein
VGELNVAEIESNLPEIDALLGRLTSWDFTRPGKEGSLGQDLAALAAENIQLRGADGKGPGGEAWPENEKRYRARKKAHYGVDKPNIRTGQMLSRESLLGDVEVSPELVRLKYGTGQPPSRTATGAPLQDADREITDIEKAFLNSPERPFYGLDETDAEGMTGEAGANLDDLLK